MAEAGKKRRYDDVARSSDYKSVFEGTPEGRRVLADIMSKADVFNPIMDTDPMSAARKEGARALALHIGSFVAFEKKHWGDIVREANGALGSET